MSWRLKMVYPHPWLHHKFGLRCSWKCTWWFLELGVPPIFTICIDTPSILGDPNYKKPPYGWSCGQWTQSLGFIDNSWRLLFWYIYTPDFLYLQSLRCCQPLKEPVHMYDHVCMQRGCPCVIMCVCISDGNIYIILYGSPKKTIGNLSEIDPCYP